jgi:hypothetical protein
VGLQNNSVDGKDSKKNSDNDESSRNTDADSTHVIIVHSLVSYTTTICVVTLEKCIVIIVTIICGH